MSDLTAEAKAALARLGAAPQKRRGQNFMVRTEALDAVADAAGVAAGDEVLEIGPGLGFLTARLLERGARVLAVEKDFVMTRHLRRAFAGRPLTVVEADFLDTAPGRGFPADVRWKVAGNIPYNITSPILEWIVTNRAHVRSAALTVQHEVARRLAASPGGKEWGALTAFVGFHADVRLVRRLGPENFFPPPRVDSAIVRLEPLPAPRHDPGDGALFSRLVRGAFQKRRKTLLNAIADVAAGLSKAELASRLAALAIDARRRPETLTLEEWARLSRSLAGLL